jgi:hypothetical protein
MMRGGVSAIVILGLCEGGCLDGSLQHPNVETTGLKKIIDKQQLATRVGRTRSHVVRVRSTPAKRVASQKAMELVRPEKRKLSFPPEESPGPGNPFKSNRGGI